MGVDCAITLPDTARMRDVADVIGILLGKKAELAPLGENSVHVKVEGVKTTSAGETLPECARIVVKDTAEGDRSFLYHFEWSHGSKDDYSINCGRGIMPSCNALNIAMGVELVKFFGGEIDYNDCDAKERDFKRAPRKDLRACNGKAWDKFQRRMYAVKPLTKEDVSKCEQYAAYR